MVNQINVGDKAPNFSLPDAENRIRRLKEFLEQTVALVFFIEAFSATCTKEVCEFRDSMSKLANLRAQVVGIEAKSSSKIKSFAEKNRIFFPILSDSKQEILKLYQINGPTILILNHKGVVQYKRTYRDATVEPDYREIEETLERIAVEDQVPKATRNVVTISRQVGSRGDEIALKICKVLGFSYLDKNMLFAAAKSIGVSEGDIIDFSEDSYKINTLLNKLLGRKRVIAATYMAKENVPILKTLDEEKSLEMIKIVVNSLASKGRIVIVGRGGQAILKNKTNVLNVRIVAPLGFRIEQLMKDEGIKREDAMKIILDSDKAHSEYLQRFHHINWDDPLNYDVVLNTASINIEIASKVIAFACAPNLKSAIKSRRNR